MTTIAVDRLVRRPHPVTGSVAALLPRDNVWFVQTYENNVDSVYRYAVLLVHDADRAEDVTADVFLRAWRSRDSFRGEGTPLSWLLSITHNSALSLLRREHGDADIDAVAEPGDSSLDPGDRLDAESDAEALREAIRRLTPEQQHVVLLRFFEGLSHEEVAARLGRNPNAVRAIQFRALCRLRKLLEGSVAQFA